MRTAATAAAGADTTAAGPPVMGVTFGVGDVDVTDSSAPAWQRQGRTITVEYEHFFVVAMYTLNSGQKLEALDTRVGEADPAVRAYLQQLALTKQVIVTGDLNTVHQDIDCFKDIRQMARVAGCTQRERDSFGATLAGGPPAKAAALVDSFRALHPLAAGVYSFWSVRHSSRPVNKGLRLDYFLCSEGMMEGLKGGGDGKAGEGGAGGAGQGMRVHDSYVLDQATVGVSDHAPIGLICLQ